MDKEESLEEKEEVEEIQEIVCEVLVAVNSILGLDMPKTMRLRGTIREDAVTILMDTDTRATHTFIFNSVACRLDLIPTYTNGYNITMENGIKVKSEGVCNP